VGADQWIVLLLPMFRAPSMSNGEKCIDYIGMESHVSLGQPDTILDRAKQMMLMENDRPHVLREMIYACRPGGILSISGVYGGLFARACPILHPSN
jgi:threonine dehydrogenase-like Zn-dependent dehydrogenase